MYHGTEFKTRNYKTTKIPYCTQHILTLVNGAGCLKSLRRWTPPLLTPRNSPRRLNDRPRPRPPRPPPLPRPPRPDCRFIFIISSKLMSIFSALLSAMTNWIHNNTHKIKQTKNRKYKRETRSIEYINREKRQIAWVTRNRKHRRAAAKPAACARNP